MGLSADKPILFFVY